MQYINNSLALNVFLVFKPPTVSQGSQTLGSRVRSGPQSSQREGWKKIKKENNGKEKNKLQKNRRNEEEREEGGETGGVREKGKYRGDRETEKDREREACEI